MFTRCHDPIPCGIVNHMEPTTRPGGGYVLFAAAVTLGGSNFLAVRLSNRELDPFWGAGLRFTLASLIFVVIVVALRLPWPRGRQLILTIANGLLGISIFYALMYWALVRVTAGTATIVLALVPLVTLLLASAQRLERLSARAVGGSFLAVVGITWMAIGPGQVTLSFIPLLALLGATVSTGESVILAKMISANHPAVTNAISLATGAATLLAFSALNREQWALPAQSEVAWALVYLVTAGSVGLFALVLLVARRWTASATAYMFVLFPVVTMVLGALLIDEPITMAGAIGALVVMSGVWFGISPDSRRSTVARPVDNTTAVLDPG